MMDRQHWRVTIRQRRDRLAGLVTATLEFSEDGKSMKFYEVGEFAVMLSVFITLSAIEDRMLGLGMAVAVIIDATVVRGVLLPAGLTLVRPRRSFPARGNDSRPVRQDQPAARSATR
jgi:RND superfamily putative drug exporter